MTFRQKYLFLFFSLYLLILSNTLLVLKNNFESNFAVSVIGLAIIIFIILFFFSYIVLFLFKKKSKNFFFYFFLIFFYFICLISTIHPNIPTPHLSLKLIFSINIIIAFLITLITIKFKIYNFLIVVSFVTIVVNTIYSSSILYHKYKKQNKDSNNSLLISKKLNLFVLSFDNIPSHIIEEQFKKDQNKNFLTDFVFFNKFISVSQATHSNIMFEMYGNKLENNPKTEPEYLDELKPNPNNLFNFIKKNNITTNFYGRYNYFLKKDELLDFQEYKFYDKIVLSLDRFVIPTLERLFTYKFTLFYKKYISEKYLWQNKQGLKQFRFFTKSIKDSAYTEKVVANIGHWFFTKPIALNKECKFVTNLNQNVNQIVGTGKCLMKLLEEFVSILKAKGIYENSIIIFKSDTGIVSTNYPKSEILSRSKNNSIYGYSIYRPFLMIKSLIPNKLDKINESVISTFDLDNYYCNEIKKNYANKFQDNYCELMGKKDLYNALYLNKIISNKKINILFDDGNNSHTLRDSIIKRIDIFDGNIDKAFLKVFPD